MIVVDASALVAIAEMEPEAATFAAAISRADRAIISPVTAAEAGFVLLARRRFAASSRYLAWLASLQVVVWREPVDAAAALEAFERYGKGRHRARLNLGDGFAYALARALDAPLLYKGDDFALTDVRPAL